MKIVVIDREDSWHVQDLKRAAKIRQRASENLTEHLIIAAGYDSVVAAICNQSTDSRFEVGNIDLADVDCIITRAMPSSSLEQVVFRMDWLAELQKQTGVLVVNPAKTIEASVDKYLSLEKIRSHGVPIPKTLVSQSTKQAMTHFEELNFDAVVKPLFGSGGRGIKRLTNRTDAQQYFENAVDHQDVIYQQEFIEHGDEDLRLLVIGDEVIGMRRQRQGEWITNAQQGASCHAHHPSEREKEIAMRSTRAVGALINGVDMVYDQQGEPKVVEINSCPSWKKTSQATGRDISAMILDLLATKRSSGTQTARAISNPSQ